MKPAGWALPVQEGSCQKLIVPDVPAPKTLMAILLDSGGAKARKAVVTD